MQRQVSNAYFEHQVFRFGVDVRALKLARNPRPTDFDAAIFAVNIAEARAADNAIREFINGRKR